jgi:hypothetical protein
MKKKKKKKKRMCDSVTGDLHVNAKPYQLFNIIISLNSGLYNGSSTLE